MNGAAQRLPRLRWSTVLGTALALLLLAAGGLEADLGHQGFRPGLVDSFPLWEEQRERVDRLGSDALILVGNSRMQMDMDLTELRRDTGLEPVQLGLGNGSFLPVLEDLAKDPAVTGTILVNFEPEELRFVRGDRAAEYVAQRKPPRGYQGWDFSTIEAILSDQLHAHLRSYADGARPLSALLLRASDSHPTVQYVKTLPDREQLGDFSAVDAQTFYYRRALRDLPTWPSPPPHATPQQTRETIEQAIATLVPADAADYQAALVALGEQVSAIRRHGGRVVFLRMPRTGYLQQIDDKRFPRRLFWDILPGLTGVPALNFEDVPVLRQFRCPDGSHLDMHDRAAFTLALVRALHLDAPAP